MVWVFGHRTLKLGHDLVRTPLRLSTTVGPVIPRLGVHHGFGVKNSNLDVLRKAPRGPPWDRPNTAWPGRRSASAPCRLHGPRAPAPVRALRARAHWPRLPSE